MAKQKGRLMLVKIGTGGTAVALCGLRSKTLNINNNEIDVTTADCTTPGGPLWTEVMEGAKRVSVTGNGYFKDEVHEATLTTLAMSDNPQGAFEIVVPGLGTFAGTFMVSLEFGGEQEDGVTYSVSLASSGVVTFTAAV